jgi:HK97 family phage major capsid protein
VTADAEVTARSRVLRLDGLEILSRAKGGDGRTVVAYAAVYGQTTEVRDSDGHYMEQIAPNAFEWTNPGVFYHHGRTLYGTPSELGAVPLGRSVEITSDARGLLTVFRVNKSQLADSVLASILNEDPMGMSFTGEFARSDPGNGPYFDLGDQLTLVTRQRILLREYGPTPYGPYSTPAYSGAEIIGVRDQQRESITVSEPQGSATPAGSDPSPEPDAQAATGDVAEPDVHSVGHERAGDDTSSSGRDPAPGTETAEPRPAPTQTRSRTMPDTDRAPLTVEERVARQSEIRARLAEIDTEYAGAELTQEARTEWQGLQGEIVEHERAVADASQRAEYLRYINDANPGATERVDNSHAGYGQPAGPGAPSNGGGYGQRGTPAFHQRDNIYDVAAIRNRARHIDEVPLLYREYAMRAVEQARFPGATGRNGAPSKEEAQERVARLLDVVDDEQGTLARRILVTGSPLYDRAFGKMLGRQSLNGLTAEESRALSLGTDAAGGFAVPFQLDPTVILTSNGVVNPLRQISRVETITGKEWDGVSSAGVVVTRGTEGQEVGTGDPALAQPAVRTQRVQGFVPFSIELDVSWGALRSQMTALLQDAKDVEEATAFTTGNGTAPNPSGVVATLGTASHVTTAGTAVLAVGDVYSLENALAPRFISNASIVASKTTYNRFRSLFQAQASAAGDPFARPSQGMGPQFNGYPKYELSTMATTITSNSLVMLQGDFSRFLIVDRVGMGVELIPHLFGSANRYPTGQRGVLALWFNSSKILTDNAFRLLKVL